MPRLLTRPGQHDFIRLFACPISGQMCGCALAGVVAAEVPPSAQVIVTAFAVAVAVGTGLLMLPIAEEGRARPQC